MSTVIELLHANLYDVFGNRDAASRRANIERVYAPDVTFTDPDGTEHGWDALDAKVESLLAEIPETFVFAEDGRRYASETTGAVAWFLGPDSDGPVARGIDVITVENGVITKLETFFAEPEA